MRKVKIKMCGVELDRREKEIGFLVCMLIGEEDVAVVAEDEFGNRRDDAFAVRAGDEKDVRVVHKRLLIQPVSPVIPRCTSTLPVVKICSTAGSTGLPQGKTELLLQRLRNLARGVGAGAAGEPCPRMRSTPA